MAADDRLATYRRMRDFAATPEPAGAPPPAPRGDGARFVIQQHDATRLHWDLRLEHDGVLVSFALPRGLPWTPDENRLAVHTEDHPLEYLDFHGEIPAGEYGGGTMTIWDRGTYDVRTFSDDEVVVTLHGQRVEGRYALFTTRGRDWLIHRVDPPQDPLRRPLPDHLRPMRPGATGLPDDPAAWAFEIRWSGHRALLANDAGRVTLTDDDGDDVTGRFPEIRRIGRRLGAVETVLDVVIVPLDRAGAPVADDARLARRLAATGDSVVRRLSRDAPVAALAVDVLWLEGHATVDLPYDDRRTLLTDLVVAGPAWQAPGNHVGDGRALLEVARARSLPGLVAKRRASSYRPGRACPDWRDVPV